MHKCSLRRRTVSVCPSVCLSVYSVVTNKRIFKIFAPSGSHTSLVFLQQTPWQYSDGTPAPSNEGIECRWVGKNRDSRQISGYRIDDWRWGANNNCGGRPCSLSHRPSRISECCLSWTITTKRREENRIYLCAAVNLKPK